MTQILKKMMINVSLLIALMLPVALIAPVMVSAQSTPDVQGSLCSGAANLKFGANAASDCDETGNEEQLNSLIADIINIFSIIVGIVAVIMMIYGGFRYITSGGETSNITTAKNTILYAIIGLIIVALAQFVVKFVLSKATGLDN